MVLSKDHKFYLIVRSLHEYEDIKYNIKYSKRTLTVQILAMSHNKIKIAIQLESGEIADLQLSPKSYKESFRSFKKLYHISEGQAFQLKNLIQAKLLEMVQLGGSWHYFTPPREKLEKQEHIIDSPRFQKVQDEEETKGVVGIVESRVQRIYGISDEQSDREFIQQSPLTPIHLKNTQQQFLDQGQQEHLHDLPKNNYIQNTQLTDKYFLEDIPQPEPFTPPQQQPFILQPIEKKPHSTISNIQKVEKIHRKPKRQIGRKNQPNPLKSKKQIFVSKEEDLPQKVSSPKRASKSRSKGVGLDRLYYQETDSFRSKQNQDIDRKELDDYLEVQKYELANRLKRTTRQFFYSLHNNTTLSWKHRVSSSNEKSYEEQESIVYKTPPKKVSVEKAYKGSTWESRMRCEAKEYQKKVKAEEVARVLKEETVKKRMKQEAKKKAGKQFQEKKQFLSRVCQKCSPKKESKQICRHSQLPSPPKSPYKQKRHYISNLLLEVYQQRNCLTNNLKKC